MGDGQSMVRSNQRSDNTVCWWTVSLRFQAVVADRHFFQHWVKVSGRSWESFYQRQASSSCCCPVHAENTLCKTLHSYITPARSHVLIWDSPVAAFDITSQSEFKSHWFFSFCPSSLWFSCQRLSCTVVGLKCFLCLLRTQIHTHAHTQACTYTHVCMHESIRLYLTLSVAGILSSVVCTEA